METPQEYINNLIQIFDKDPENEYVVINNVGLENFDIRELKHIALDQGYIFTEAKYLKETKNIKHIKFSKWTQKNCYVLLKI